ncbi:hypothetical protein [Streptomyces yangpuensis]|uniref:hypothetical protein n=1 Tax=Streptomyces yangpuensis TaxID=1648182 RepID=UPI00380E1AC1
MVDVGELDPGLVGPGSAVLEVDRLQSLGDDRAQVTDGGGAAESGAGLDGDAGAGGGLLAAAAEDGVLDLSHSGSAPRYGSGVVPALPKTDSGKVRRAALRG